LMKIAIKPNLLLLTRILPTNYPVLKQVTSCL
jgi:hypothetical protein